MKHVLRVINVLSTVVILVAFVVLLRTVFTPAELHVQEIWKIQKNWP